MTYNIIIKKENEELREEVERLKKELNILSSVIDRYLATDILDHLNFTNSITKTANHYRVDPKWLYSKIPEWDDCNERLYGLSDYKEYEYKIEDNSN
jgi:hypothetical protein